MNVTLREPLLSDYEELSEYVKELRDSVDAEGCNGLYKAINENTFPNWLLSIKQKNSKTLLIINQEDKIVGIINIRYVLNDYLKRGGGHIGYNIRPSERRKGYASQALELILEDAYNYGLEDVLIDCYKGNIGSEKTIESSGATLYSEEYSEERKNTLMRYKINVKEKYEVPQR
jgi:predicted acetyltransferase